MYADVGPKHKNVSPGYMNRSRGTVMDEISKILNIIVKDLVGDVSSHTGILRNLASEQWLLVDISNDVLIHLSSINEIVSTTAKEDTQQYLVLPVHHAHFSRAILNSFKENRLTAWERHWKGFWDPILGITDAGDGSTTVGVATPTDSTVGEIEKDIQEPREYQCLTGGV